MLDISHYHPWEGRRFRSPWWACLTIVRVALLQLFRRKVYWFVLGLGLMQFVMFWTVIYAVNQLQLQPQMRENLLSFLGFDASPGSGQESGYVSFMQRQSVVVMMLLAFAGSLLVGADFRLGSIPFYLSRRIDRRHYIVGKLLAVSCIVSLVTVAPALLLYLEWGLFSPTSDYWIERLDLLGSILSYGLVLCVTLSILIVALAAYLQRAAPLAITWASLFVLSGAAGDLLAAGTRNPHWRLLSPWRDIRLVGRMLFDAYRDPEEVRLARWALLILVGLCGVALAALVRKVKAVEVVG